MVSSDRKNGKLKILASNGGATLYFSLLQRSLGIAVGGLRYCGEVAGAQYLCFFIGPPGTIRRTLRILVPYS